MKDVKRIIERIDIKAIALMAPFAFVLSTVFIVAPDLAEPTVSGKYFWFYVGMGLVSLATIAAMFFYKKQVCFSPFDFVLLSFCLAGLCITFFHVEAITTKCISLLLLLCLYFYLRVFLSQNKLFFPFLLVVIVATGLVEAVWGLKQLYGFATSQHNLFKTTGSFFNPGPYAGYLAVVLPIALSGWLNPAVSTSKMVVSLCKWFCCLTFIAIILILPATMSRAAWLAASVGCLIVCYGKYADKIKGYCSLHKKRVIQVGSVLAICVVLILIGIYYLKRDSANGRLLIWKTSLNVLANRPGGVGVGRFSRAYGEGQAAYFATGNASAWEEQVAGNPEYAFNEYLQVAVEWGVIPFLLFIVMIVWSIIVGYKRKYWAPLAALGSLLVFATMSYPFSVLPFGILLVVLLSMIHSTIVWQVNKRPFYVYAILLVCILLTGYSLYNRYPKYQSYKKWNMAQVFYTMNNYGVAAKEYKELYPQLNDRIQFLFEYGRILSQTGSYEESNLVLHQASQVSCDPMIYNIMGKNHQAMQHYDLAEEAFLKSTYLVPSRIYPWYLLTKLYDEMGLKDKAIQTAKIVLVKEPKVHSPAVDEMREEVKRLMRRKK